jgi:protein SCO1/2
MSNSKRPLNPLLVGVLAALAAIGGLVVAQFTLMAPEPTIESGTLLKQPRAIESFTLTDTQGQAFDKARLEGGWSLIFTGFTYCPDVCPNTLGVLKSVKQKLDQDSVPLQIVFVSVDPERDTPEQLGRYVEYFSPEFIAATGDKDNLDSLTRSLSLVYAKVPGTTPQSYTMDHSAALVLIDPQARVAGYFLPPHKIDVLARDLETAIKLGIVS